VIRPWVAAWCAFAASALWACASEEVVLLEASYGGGGSTSGGALAAPGGSPAGGAASGGGGRPSGGSSGSLTGGSAGAPTGGNPGSARGGAPSAGGSGRGGAPAQGGSGPQGGFPNGGQGTGMPATCSPTQPCPPGFNCQTKNCGDASGICEPIPVRSCELDGQNIVCGCDGITYWNDCVRRLGPAMSATAGQCQAAAICYQATDCPAFGASCAHLYSSPDECGPGGPPGPGTCWVLPQSCMPDPADTTRWQDCGGPQPGRCDDSCNSIRSGHPHFKDQQGMCP
jgi:hypothetical protein